MVVARGRGQGETGNKYLMGTEFQFYEMQRAMKIMVIQIYGLLNIMDCTLKMVKMVKCMV